MAGVLGIGWREGNRSEYLAQYFLSKLGVSVPVIRQEDIGVDFYCALAREESGRLTFHSPFAVQAGAAGGKEFIYGGIENGKWRKAAIDWLFSQELPLFVCTIDRKELRFRMYSTSPMWHLHYSFPNMTKVELCPEAAHDPIRESRSAERINGEGIGDGYSYRTPLLKALVDLVISDLEDRDLCSKAREVLRLAIYYEQMNITYRRLGVNASSRFTDIVPNSPESLGKMAGGVFWSHNELKPELMEAFKSVSFALALNLGYRGDAERISQLAPVFKLFPVGEIPDWIADKLPDEIKAVLADHS